jgi:hypothetical protein
MTLGTEKVSNPAMPLENPADYAHTNQVIEPSKSIGHPP